MGTAVSAGKAPAKPSVSIIYRDETVVLDLHPRQPVHALLEQALGRFHIAEHRADYALYDGDGRQLDGDVSLEDAGVGAGDHLVLRSTVISIVYNGPPKTVPYQADELVSAMLAQAIELFHITTNAHIMALYDEAGNELGDNQTLAQAGVEPGDRLVLRQSAVKGG